MFADSFKNVLRELYGWYPQDTERCPAYKTRHEMLERICVWPGRLMLDLLNLLHEMFESELSYGAGILYMNRGYKKYPIVSRLMMASSQNIWVFEALRPAEGCASAVI
jgi:hypothetical protein